MRKKADTGPGKDASTPISSKTIAKKPRTTTSIQTGRARLTRGATSTLLNGASTPVIDNSDQLASRIDNAVDDNISISDSRDRSSSPVESDLLRYLTAHIAPPDADASFSADVTSFVIGRDEYLEGIVRLIQSDCPEVVDNMASFIHAIQGAFHNVTGMTAC